MRSRAHPVGGTAAATTLAVVAAVLLTSACQPTATSSVTSIIDEMADLAGTDRVAKINVERLPDTGLKVSASFVVDDDTALQFVKRPDDDAPAKLGSPTPRVLMAGVPVSSLDLAGLEQRMDEVPDCEDPRGELFVFAGRTAENVRCGVDGTPTGRLDGAEVPVIAQGDLASAADQLATDGAMLGAAHVGRARIVMTDAEVWTELHVVEPGLPASDGKPCALLMTRTGGSFYPVCESADERHPFSAIDTGVITKIWQAEGEPRSGWRIELTDHDGETRWRTTREQHSAFYTLDGAPA